MCPCGTSANCQGGSEDNLSLKIWKKRNTLLLEVMREIFLVKCNCDSNFETFDDGHLTGDMAGITAIYALMDNRNQNGHGRFTVGPLNCTGDCKREKTRFAKVDKHTNLLAP